MRFIIDVLKYIKYLMYKVVYIFLQIPFRKVKILTDEETVEYLLKNKVSYSRFGDGEFNWILKNKQNSFQDDNEEMANRMKEILLNSNDKVLIGIPLGLKKVSEFVLFTRKFWTYTFVRNYNKLLKYIPGKIYGNASVTRPYIDYKNRKNSMNKFINLKRLWDNKDVIIVEGEKTKIGVGNDLMDNAKSLKRIICPSKNAYGKYNEILETIKNDIDKDKLILIALGPTATILAYDLGQLDYQAIDIGHIDVEYEWCGKNVKDRVSLVGKSVNECKNSETENMELTDKKYEESILKKIL